ncbi:tetratricopeptide repeat protein [Vibrio lentus]|uniref:tetratricopeptide repeat protein n=1 Tax=Vibrio lentus TaxID=136468 RepID=UPI0021C2E7E0|nr:tetratricopeptide repeat protein [Vibrio lentus]MDN3630395.1 tetratricopeptide repeat protein [Vibrio lentus]
MRIFILLTACIVIAGCSQNSTSRVSRENAVELGPATKKVKEAAVQGDAYNQDYLGYLYTKGIGVPQNDKQAAYWFRKAAEQGNASAQTNLGVMYFKGQGVLQDNKQAVRWYR